MKVKCIIHAEHTDHSGISRTWNGVMWDDLLLTLRQVPVDSTLVAYPLNFDSVKEFLRFVPAAHITYLDHSGRIMHYHG